MGGGFYARAFDGAGFYVGVFVQQATRIAVGTVAALTAPQGLAAQPTLAVGALAALVTASPLAGAPALRVLVAAELSTFTGITGSTGLAVGVTPPRLTASTIDLSSGAAAFYVPLGFQIPGFGLGQPHSGIIVGSTVGLRAPVIFRTLAGVLVGVAPPFLRLPADLRVLIPIIVGTQANLVLAGPLGTDGIVVINGLPASVRVGSMTIRDVLNEATNTLDCLLDDPPIVPVAGQDIKVGLGSILPSRLIFAGVIQSVDQTYTLTPKHKSWIVRASDYGVLLNRRQLWAEYTNTSATTIVRDLVTTYASGFTLNHVAADLPVVSLAFDGVNLSEALTQVALAIGGYWYVDYVKDVHLFVSEIDPATDPKPIDPTPPQHLDDPPITLRTDHSQIRTRIVVLGISVPVLAPVRAGASVIPIEDAAPFAGGGTIQFRKGTRAPYTSTAAGDATALLVGNITAPTVPPFPQLATAPGGLSGTYAWAVTFATAQGETLIGPISASLFCPAVAAPGSTIGIGATGQIGPLVGAYTYRVAFLTALGETALGPPASRVAGAVTVPALTHNVGPAAISRLTPGTYQWRLTYVSAIGETSGGPPLTVALADVSPPGGCQVGAAALPGLIPTGIPVSYRITFVSQDGETAGGTAVPYTPPGLQGPVIAAPTAFRFGGLYNGPYSYGVSIVTAAGESGLTASLAVGSGFYTEAPSTAPQWTGSQNTTGRIAPGWTYAWAASYFSDAFGETPLSLASQVPVGGAYSVQLLIQTPGGGGLPSGADGVRIYRRQADGPFTLNAEFRRGNVPYSYWDSLEQGEHGGAWPVQPQRAGVGMQLTIGASPEAGILARRIYRTKAGGNEYFLVGELQSNVNAFFVDTAFDENLTTRSVPGAGASGRQIALSAIPVGPAGTVGRRLYRSKAGSGAYFLIGEVKDNTTATWIDNAPDTALTITLPGINSAGAGYLGQFQPLIGVPLGPPGVVARRLYRTAANGVTARLVAELADNTTGTFLDNVPDVALGAATVPVTSPAGGEQHLLSSLALGPPSILARRIYRTVAGGTDFRLAGQINDNTTTTWVDAVADRDLGNAAPLVTSAGASAVALGSIQTGPPEVTERRIYRTGGTRPFNLFEYVGAIANNLDTVFVDDRADEDLGRPLNAAGSTIGALSGSTYLTLDTVAGFPPAGWVDVEGHLVSYTGIAGTTLTGIPPLVAATITRSGPVATITVGTAHGWTSGETIAVIGVVQPQYAGAHVVTVVTPTQATFPVEGAPASPATSPPGDYLRVAVSGALLREVPGSAIVETVPMVVGVSGMVTPRKDDETVTLLVICNDLAAQTSLAAAEGGDGIHEAIVQDNALDSVAACTARGNAELKLFAWPQVEVTYATHDPQTRSGRPIAINLPSLGMVANLKILEVTIDEIAAASHLYPRCVVKAASAKFSLTDLLRHAVLDV